VGLACPRFLQSGFIDNAGEQTYVDAQDEDLLLGPGRLIVKMRQRVSTPLLSKLEIDFLSLSRSHWEAIGTLFSVDLRSNNSASRQRSEDPAVLDGYRLTLARVEGPPIIFLAVATQDCRLQRQRILFTPP
jgi:hypothetical protein